MIYRCGGFWWHWWLYFYGLNLFLSGTHWCHLCIQLCSCVLGISSGGLWQFSENLELDLLDVWVETWWCWCFKETLNLHFARVYLYCSLRYLVYGMTTMFSQSIPDVQKTNIIYHHKCPTHNCTAEYNGSLKERVSNHRNQTTSAIRNQHIHNHPKAELKDFTWRNRDSNTLHQ